MIADLSECVPEILDRAGRALSKVGLELGEGHLDGVEVRRIGRKKQHPCASGFDGLFRRRALVGGEIVQDNHVAWLQRGSQLGLDIGIEDSAVHGLADDERRHQLVVPQSGDEGFRLPMAERRRGAQPLTLGRPPPEPRHFGGGAGLIQENQAVSLLAHDRLAQGNPRFPVSPDVRSPLLGREQCFF